MTKAVETQVNDCEIPKARSDRKESNSESEISPEIFQLIQEIRECFSNPVPNSLKAACELVSKTGWQERLVQRLDIAALALKAYVKLLERYGVDRESLETVMEFRTVFKLSIDTVSEIEERYYLDCVRNGRIEAVYIAWELLGSRRPGSEIEGDAVMAAYISKVCSGKEEEAENLLQVFDYQPKLTLVDILERA